ncbi:MAG: L,D-transpeptidase family protein [Candidatus Omnitrophica bacterium]|nr:L,D-transpeptidase family protein [Candidatus Omnitrophota bacterium]
MNRRLLIAGLAALAVLAIIASVAMMIKKNNASVPSANTDNASLAVLLSQAKELEAKGNLLEAKAVYQKLVTDFPNLNGVMEWQKKTEELTVRSILSPAITARSISYEIKPGDTLGKIAREHKTTVELIQKTNSIPNDKISPGRKIKIWTAPFSIFVDKSQNSLLLKVDDEIVKSYIVSTGKDNSTPVGTFKITNKLMNPTWFKAGAVVPADSPENILGTRWLGFNIPGYGIHGTTEPQSLGQQATQGCVRMLNAEVEELYTLVPVGTEVTIVD